MFLFVVILVMIILIETSYILLGKENLKQILKKGLEDLSGSRNIDYSHGLYATEANDFIEYLKNFFQSITLAEYKANSGWLEITYTICGIKVQDREAVKRAICIELHSYFQKNHGVNFWSYYIPVLTEDTMMIKIAASPAAEREYQNLHLTEARPDKMSMEE